MSWNTPVIVTSRLEGDSIPPEVAKRLAPLRTLRKRLAAICLFIILAVQIEFAFPAYFALLLLALAAAFSWRVYKIAVPYGWI